MKLLFVYPRFSRHADHHPELRDYVPMKEYLGSPSLGIASIAAATPDEWTVEFRDDRLTPADAPTDADLVALSMFTPAASRGLELARYFRGEGKTVVAGGIFATMMPEEVCKHADAAIVGEGEAVWPQVLADFAAGELRSVYGPSEPCDLAQVPLPKLSLYLERESEFFRPDDYPVQSSRGCPLTCRACALPKSMGTRTRAFPLEHVIGQIDQLAKAGKRACLTEDTSWFIGSRTRGLLGKVLDDLTERRSIGSAATISYIGISMPMILTTPVSFLERAKAAGVDMFYLVGGFDPITMKAFTGEDDKALQRAHDAIARCHDVGIEPYTSFLIGGDQDDEGTADRMLEFAAKAEILKSEFAIFTPYPGTPSWHEMVEGDRILTRDWSRYNDANVVFRPAKMTPERLQADYVRLWRDFYADRKELGALSETERTIQF